MNYYNEFDRNAAAWLRELIAAGLIPQGHVDERSITDVKPDDLRGYTQCHFFAGIGGWSYALQLAEWPADRPVWTGSCPCQPFSVGSNCNAKGTGDERDLWPTFFKIIGECKPTTIFGEQVANSIQWGWLDRSKLDCESQGYSFAAAVLPAYAVGAVHERKRLYWVADSSGTRRERCEQIKSLPSGQQASQSKHGNPFARARSGLAGNRSDLLFGDGVSVRMVRGAIKGYGNAIVPQVAAEFIQAYLDICPE